ncbi:MAG: sugar phosphate isomerase/epimerase family protein [Opitutaceae bacterium]|nr:sugar phosphate isomerase/epimerase family protein [Opitutaceae bacterium]
MSHSAVSNSRSTLLTRRGFLGGVMLAGAGATIARAAAGSRWQIGCYTRPWAEHEYRVALDGIAEAGYAHAGLMTAKDGVIVGPDTPAEKVRQMATEANSRGLKIASIYGGNFLAKNSVPEGVAALKRLVDNVALCSCPALLLGGTSRAETVDNYYRVVADCADYARSKGVSFSVKPHGGTNATGPQCRQLIEKVGRAKLGLWYDPGNIFFYSEGKLDPVDDSETVDGLVVGMSVKDYRPPKDVALTLGTGQVNFAKVFGRLQRGGFRGGPLIVECLAPGSVAQITAEAKKARRFLETLVTQA